MRGSLVKNPLEEDSTAALRLPARKGDTEISGAERFVVNLRKKQLLILKLYLVKFNFFISSPET